LAQLPEFGQLAFPAVLSKRLGVDVKLLFQWQFQRASGMSCSEIHEGLREAHMSHYHFTRYAYYSMHVFEREERLAGYFDRAPPPLFSAFGDQSRWAGHHASGMLFFGCPFNVICFSTHN
jgi:hypothetical protein